MEELREADGARMKMGAQAHGREKARSPGDKLKNESSARKAMSRKLRQGKKDNTLTAEERKLIRKKHVARQIVISTNSIFGEAKTTE